MKLARVFALAIPLTGVVSVRAADSPPVPVVVTTARSENFGASLSATGTVMSRNDARISGEVGGTLAWIAEPGTRVLRGDTLARIDSERLALTLRDNEAVVKRLEAQLTLLATQRARLQSLGNVVSQSQLEEAQSRERMAEQDVEQARVARDRARLDLNRATVRAPFAGIVAAWADERIEGSRPAATAPANSLRRLMKTASGVISDGLIFGSECLRILVTQCWLEGRGTHGCRQRRHS